MRRRKLFNIRRIALAFAVALIVPAGAQAKSTPNYELGPGEIPYLSQGVGVSPQYFAGSASSTPQKRVVTPYLSQGVGVTSAELGFTVGQRPDDRPYSRAPSLETTPAVSDEGGSIDFGTYTLTGTAIALLLAIGGMGFAVWHNRREKLSPA